MSSYFHDFHLFLASVDVGILRIMISNAQTEIIYVGDWPDAWRNVPKKGVKPEGVLGLGAKQSSKGS